LNWEGTRAKASSVVGWWHNLSNNH